MTDVIFGNFAVIVYALWQLSAYCFCCRSVEFVYCSNYYYSEYYEPPVPYHFNADYLADIGIIAEFIEHVIGGSTVGIPDVYAVAQIGNDSQGIGYYKCETGDATHDFALFVV